MDVFTLARHEYLQPPVPKHGRQSSQQQQQQQQQSSNNISGSGGGGTGGGGGGGGGGSGAGSVQTSFSIGMFGQLNQSSSS